MVEPKLLRLIDENAFVYMYMMAKLEDNVTYIDDCSKPIVKVIVLKRPTTG